MGDFQKLNVWRRSKDLAVYLYTQTSQGEFYKDFGLRDQIRRAAVSISSNIAEGDELGSNKQSIRFFKIAKGSTAEVLNQAIIAQEIGYLSEDQTKYIDKECTSISSMLTKLIKVRKENE